MRARISNPARFTLLLASILLCSIVLTAQAPVPHSSHVVLLIDENTSLSTSMQQMPFLIKQGAANGYAANYSSDTTGSLMDYLWLASGSCGSSSNCTLPAGTHDFDCSGNDCASPITDDNIFRQMNNNGITWKIYAQSYAAAGGTVTTPDLANGTHYYRRHNGATWYSDILNNVSGSQGKIVDFSQFASDLANNALPQFTIIAPDGLNDGHDASPADADTFLSNNLPALFAEPYFQSGGDGLMIITFDNGDDDDEGQVYTAVIGPNVTPHTVSKTAYKHENSLRTLLDALGISDRPGASAAANPMTDFFSGYVTINSPALDASIVGGVPVSATAVEANAQIYQLQVWDNTTGQKLGQSAANTSSISQTFSLAPGVHQIVVEDISTGSFAVLHKASFTVTVGDGVAIASPAANATTGTQVQVSASASESSAQVYQLQVWDNTTGQKLGQSAANTSSISQTFSLAPGSHQLIVEDISADNFAVLHRALVNITVTGNGVSITSPVPNSTSGTQVLVSATAAEANSQIYQLQVWDNTTGQKLGQSAANTSSISQTFSLSAGTHQLIVEDISAGNFSVMHQSSVTIDVSTTAGVTILSPADNAMLQELVLVAGSANSATPIDHLEVWDATSGAKLANSFGTEVDQMFSLAPGPHSLVVQAVSAGNFQIVGKSTVSVTVN